MQNKHVNNQQMKSWLVKFKDILYQAKQSTEVNKQLHSTGALTMTSSSLRGKQRSVSDLFTSHRKFVIKPKDKYWNQQMLIQWAETNKSTTNETNIETKTTKEITSKNDVKQK